ncbi:MAG: Do family serine endopeptidase [Bacteroidales bacterium]
MRRGTLIVLLIGASIIGSVTTVSVTSLINKGEINNNDTELSASGEINSIVRTSLNTGKLENDFTKAAESTVNGVVSVRSFITQRNVGSRNGYIDPFEFFFGPRSNQGRNQQVPQQSEPQALGLGSGVIISEDGYIVTNNHVVDGADKLEVTLNDNRTFNAKIIGKDPTSDLALIKIETEGLKAIEFGDSEAIQVGEWVLAVGNPFGFTSTVTAGIVSAKARSISSATQSASKIGLESFIQTDAAVNQGNSGGALVNSDGELVGINTAIYSQTGNYTGYSFAIPSSIVKKVITDIRQYGTVQRAILGVAFQELTSELAKDKGITATSSGIYVARVEDRSAALEAGIEVGDVITMINGAKVTNTGDMMGEMSKYRPGDKIKLTYIRDNKGAETTATLQNSQGDTKITKAADVMNLGCAFKELTDSKRKELLISRGVEVTGIKAGKFQDAGIKNGFIITDINNRGVNSRDDIEEIYNTIMSAQGDKVMFISGLYPTGRKMYYAVDLSE